MGPQSNREKGKQKAVHTGLAAGNAGVAEIYSDNVIFQAERGHGTAAEKANHLKDVWSGKDAKHMGGNNAKNGPDRYVDGAYIQTKYCRTGSDCIKECFDKNNHFRYWSPDGTPMQIEVPSDKYDAAIQAMEERIRKGQLPGISDPQKAKEIVRKGSFTYAQARNIARFGTVESLIYDGVNGIKVSGTAMGVSAIITYAHALWNGESPKVALEQACYSGMQVFGVTFFSSVITAQLGRTGVEAALRGGTDFLVKQMGPKAASWIASGIKGGNIYGAAAMNHLSKLLRGNIVTGIVTTAVLSSVDVGRLVRGKISGAQAFKNISTTAAGVAGGTGGWMAGAAAGATVGSFIPIVGTAVGGLVGGLCGAFLGSSAASTVTKSVLDEFIEDDAKEMLHIFESCFAELAFDFLLSENEIELLSQQMQELDMAGELRNMYASDDRRDYAVALLEPMVIEVVKARPVIPLPTNEQVLDCSRGLMEKIVEQTA
ncbi:hypothetical protein [Heliophilum fasciatum]|uniref:Inner membrane protein yeeR n=1 Tax=Heliophilum fasciatum TaxID=35700 RepID=A0A4R2REH9_9FIRM|nr:hypothetical protein [Heliophilum fasciatum]MCW2279148.1 hypothetical protein [Heliophilum fasciatum]TCP61233.1 hypothetical protein EDD73_13025 [Heliophilum fasciatum]